MRSSGHKPPSRDGRPCSVAAVPPHLEEIAQQKRGQPLNNACACWLRTT
nr:MAG TPA: hypothetical protein [Caudoviricetes sp.]DAU30390.1 MAG TPA: hypothetical protein [Caudoviricetes sp.]DAX95264.1 MAG TPA: hypothetical protein [Caudoviricetes sp.]